MHSKKLAIAKAKHNPTNMRRTGDAKIILLFPMRLGIRREAKSPWAAKVAPAFASANRIHSLIEFKTFQRSSFFTMLKCNPGGVKDARLESSAT
jgi:hypothetical protein